MGFFRANLALTIVAKQQGRTKEGDRPLPLEGVADFIRRQRAGASGIVYALTRDETASVAEYLVTLAVPVHFAIRAWTGAFQCFKQELVGEVQT